MSNRIDLSDEAARRLRVHIAQVPGRNQRDFIQGAVLEKLDRVATPAERIEWGEAVPGAGVRTAALCVAAGFDKPFRLQQVVDALDAQGVTAGVSDHTLRLSLGAYLREAGFISRRMRLEGSSPTQCWVPPVKVAAPVSAPKRRATASA